MSGNLACQDEYTWEELIDGKVVAMSPRPTVNHHRITQHISYIFERYLKGKRCSAFADGVDLYLTEKDRFIPDVMVVCDPDKIQWDGVHGVPDLVVEVLSPSTQKNDRLHKKEVYEKCGVREYWLVDAIDRNIEQYFLRDGKLELNEVYHDYKDYELGRLNDEERAAVVTRFKCSLFDDLEIAMEDIFYGLLPMPQ